MSQDQTPPHPGQSVADFWHGTSTVVVPASPEPFVLRTVDAHGGPRPWANQAGVSAPPRYAYVDDLITIVFSMVAARAIGGEPVVTVVRYDADDLHPDPTYVEMLLNAEPHFLNWKSSYLACGRVALSGEAPAVDRLRCTDITTLGQVIDQTGLDKQVIHWADPNSFRADAHRQGLTDDSPFSFRDTVGNTILRRCFQHF